ncbi:MAG: hypothetical protein IJ785_00840 [Bacteroidales bacterium]|nr:hypothetical protein [Bacteroidales bacterium]
MNKSLTRILLLGALISAALFSACQKDGVVTLRARIGHFGSQDKVFMGGEENLTPFWRNGDTVIVNGAPYTLAGSTNSGSRLEVARAASYWAVFPASITPVASQSDSRINVSLPALQPYYTASDGKQAVNAPMGAYLESDASSGSITFTNMGALLAINIVNNTGHVNITVDSVSVRATGIPLWGDGYVADYRTDSRRVVLTSTLQGHDSVVLARPNPDFPDDPSASRSLSMGLAVTNAAEVYVYVPSCEPLTPNRYRIIIHAHAANNVDVSESNEQSESNPYAGCIPNNSLAPVNFSLGNSEIEYPEGAVHGVFTVADGRQVYFSQGNLQYQASTRTWRFAEHQWDFVGGGNFEGTVDGSDNELISSSYSGWIDLFCWATSGANTRYPPYYHSTDATAYPNIATMAGTVYFYDWGYNAISNGGNQPQIWRTLSSTEWNYLLRLRTFGNNSGEGYSFKYVSVSANEHTISGMLIFPDNYTNQLSVGDVINQIPEGCVFLPQGGYRFDVNVTNDQKGHYWTSLGPGNHKAYTVDFPNRESNLIGQHNMSYGYSVRLAKNIN